MNLFDKVPRVPQDAFVAPNATLIGDVTVGSRSSVWYGAVLRGTHPNSRPANDVAITPISLRLSMLLIFAIYWENHCLGKSLSGKIVAGKIVAWDLTAHAVASSIF